MARFGFRKRFSSFRRRFKRPSFRRYRRRWRGGKKKNKIMIIVAVVAGLFAFWKWGLPFLKSKFHIGK